MYRVTEAALGRPDYRMEPQRKFALGPSRAEIADTLPARSITAYSSRRLAHADTSVP